MLTQYRPMAYVFPKSDQPVDLLISEILLELSKLPPERLAEAYRKLREIRGLKPRPGTGPLAPVNVNLDKEG